VNGSPPIIEARHLVREFGLRRAAWRRASHPAVTAVDDVSIRVEPGESVGLVGESGSGKTTLSRLLLRLDRPTRGSVLFRGEDVAALAGGALGAFRRAVQPVFQDPYSSLDPRMRVSRIVSEPLRAAGDVHRNEIDARVAQVLGMVELEPDAAVRYPAAFSGGQRQRIAIARALISDPDLIILDEAVSSQDVSIRAQILNLLKDIQRERGVAYLFISHDLGTVHYLCSRVCVMYRGSIVETGTAGELYGSPQHAYTKSLLGAWLPLR